MRRAVTSKTDAVKQENYEASLYSFVYIYCDGENVYNKRIRGISVYHTSDRNHFAFLSNCEK